MRAELFWVSQKGGASAPCLTSLSPSPLWIQGARLKPPRGVPPLYFTGCTLGLPGTVLSVPHRPSSRPRPGRWRGAVAFVCR